MYFYVAGFMSEFLSGLKNLGFLGLQETRVSSVPRADQCLREAVRCTVQVPP